MTETEVLFFARIIGENKIEALSCTEQGDEHENYNYYCWKIKGKIFERCNRRVYKAAEQIMQIGDHRSG
ncbi:hypothetical protein FAEUMB_27700 [Faecalimonas umbilicata]|uniref:Uncharacterized protein n=1 Tax=Faecalimonas umbilicata TaxID=1912855 RepID=A0ABQ0R0L0_9FIRM|nr:hypothetical protein FAEUMB_27700 [Faecalimonas umbilicata]